MLSVEQGKARVLRMVRRLRSEQRLAIDGCRWERSDVFTNPSTPVLTLMQRSREVVSVCITWRKLERMDRGETMRIVQRSILSCYRQVAGASGTGDGPGSAASRDDS